ncbi:hypothetical protein ACQPW3_12055 [Actinosynnema sp. CA-248983]
MHKSPPDPARPIRTRNRVDGHDHYLVLQVGAVYGDVTFAVPPRDALPLPGPPPLREVVPPADARSSAPAGHTIDLRDPRNASGRCRPRSSVVGPFDHPYSKSLLRWLSCFPRVPIPLTLITPTILAGSPVFAGLTAHDVTTGLAALADAGLVTELTVRFTANVEPASFCFLLPDAERSSRTRLAGVSDPYVELCVAAVNHAMGQANRLGAQRIAHLAALLPHHRHLMRHPPGRVRLLAASIPDRPPRPAAGGEGFDTIFSHPRQDTRRGRARFEPGTPAPVLPGARVPDAVQLIEQVELVTRLWSEADIGDQSTLEPVMSAFARLFMMIRDLEQRPDTERTVPMRLPELRATTTHLLATFTAWIDDGDSGGR